MKKILGLLMFFVLIMPAICRGQANIRKTADSPDHVYSGSALRQAHPTNLWEALKLLEPSLCERDAGQYGSDPNHVPTGVELQGSNRWQAASSSTPLFILDHARVDARKIYDLDINEVAEVIVRKSASAYASYGVKGGQGIIEIHTLRPEAGSIRLSYTFDGSFQWADLHTYHLLNASEKLQLEKQSGLYQSDDPVKQQQLAALLAEREATLAQGGGEDWLRIPLQTAFTHRHSLSVSGGDEFVRYRLNLRATPGSEGVMRGSKRDIYAGNAYVEYRYRSLTLSNRIHIDKLQSTASPFGSYDYYATINPYFSGKDKQGFLYNKLGEGSFNEQINPLYETSLSSFNEMESLHLYNNFSAGYTFGKHFSANGNFAFIRNHSQQDIYTSPESALYDETGKYNGEYAIRRTNALSYEGNLTLGYANTTGHSAYGGRIGLHVFRGETDFDSYSGIGIPIDRMAYISFATSYAFGTPVAGKSYERMLSGLLEGWYVYDGRYELHASVRMDKSSLLAPRKRRAAFYAADLQWNIHQEAFLSGQHLFERLSLGAGIGTNGDIGFTEEAWRLMYHYNIGNEYISNYYLIGNKILGAVNPAMKWSTTLRRNISLDAAAKGISLHVNYYDNLTRDLPIVIPAGLATGFESLPANGGRIRNYGVEYSISADIPTPCRDLYLKIFTDGIHHRNKITELPAYFREQHNKAAESGARHPSLLEEGASVYDIYATRQGQEGFTAIGNALPKLRGNFGVQLGWRNWAFNALFDFSLGGHFYNETLEAARYGSNAFNLDHRAIENGIRDEGVSGDSGERFVEKRNELTLGNIGIAYDFRQEFARKLYMKNLSAAITANRLFSVSSADYRQGTLYPYARTLTLSLRATF